MRPNWGLQDPGGAHVGHMNFAIWVRIRYHQLTATHHPDHCLFWQVYTANGRSVNRIIEREYLPGPILSDGISETTIGDILKITISCGFHVTSPFLPSMAVDLILWMSNYIPRKLYDVIPWYLNVKICPRYHTMFWYATKFLYLSVLLVTNKKI